MSWVLLFYSPHQASSATGMSCEKNIVNSDRTTDAAVNQELEQPSTNWGVSGSILQHTDP